MNEFTKDLQRGMVIGFKAALTGYFMLAVFCVAFTGIGLVMGPFIVCEGLDMIWGRK